MKTRLKVSAPDLREMFTLFPPEEGIPEHKLVTPEEMPEPSRGLLVHEHHMTVTVEAFHGGPVDVRILARRHTSHWYARKILLTLQGSGKVVLFGIVRLRFRYCSIPIRDEILAGRIPLGRILIQHDVLRRIQPTAYLRLTPTAAMVEWFGLDPPQPVYGRLGLIYCNDKPAVELLEIVPP